MPNGRRPPSSGFNSAGRGPGTGGGVPRHDCPQLNVTERFWKKRRRRATHNRLFDTVADPKESVRNSLGYFQTVRGRLLTLINGRPEKSKK